MIAEAERDRISSNKDREKDFDRNGRMSELFDFLEENNIEIPFIPQVYETGNIEIDQKKELEYRLFTIEEGMDGCWYKNTDGSIGKKIYPISNYSKIMRLPDNIQPDWLEAAEKAVALCYTDRFKLTEKDWKYIKETVEPRIKKLNSKQNGG